MAEVGDLSPEALAEVRRDIHVLPVGDLKKHKESRQCWCRPEVKGAGLVVHNSLDRRELYERNIN